MNDDDFFVGYAEAPASSRRFLRGVVPLIVLAGLAVAGTLSASWRDPGRGSWEWDVERTVSGLLRVDPYPRLVRADGRSALLVAVGKHGVEERAAALAGQHVSVRGTLLERDGQLMVEVADADDALVPAGPADASASAASQPASTARAASAVDREPTTGARAADHGDALLDGARVELVGEILDSKCHLGAMKPGDGKTHRACATLCLDGGIPPVLGTWDAAGTASYWLLTDLEGGPAQALVRGVVGEPVRVQGEHVVRDGQAFLAIRSVERLGDG